MKEQRRSILLIAEWVDHRFQFGVARYAKQAGWHLNLDAVYNNVLPQGWRGDGCIALMGDEQYVAYVRSLRVPVLEVSHQIDSTYPRIHEDDHAIGVLAAEHLLDLGFQHFACYRTSPLDVALTRSHGFSDRLAETGCTAEEIVRTPRSRKRRANWGQRMEWLSGKLQALPKPVGIFCIDDRMAVDIIETCMHGGIRIPDDIAVLGVGNLELACETSAVPISSIRIDYESFGYQAAELLGRILDGEPPPTTPILLPPLGVEARRSTDTLAVEDPAGRKAVRFMLDHFADPIAVNEIATAVHMSRRQLTYITRKELATTPAALLEAIRIKKACALLKTTNYPIKRVAYETGLGSAMRLQRIFRRRFETTPTAWRKAQR